MSKEAIDLEIGQWLVIDGDTARRVTGLEVHCQRGDGLHDGEVRIIMGSLKLVYRHDRKVKVLRG